MRFYYTASDRQGSLRKGVIEASSAEAVQKALLQRALVLLELERLPGTSPPQLRLEPSSEPPATAARRPPDQVQTLTPRPERALTERLYAVRWRAVEQALLLHQLHLMFSSGVPLHQAIENLCRGWEGRSLGVREALGGFWRALSRGRTFAQAALVSGLVRPEQAVAISVGEATGRLEPILKELARNEEQRWRLRGRVGAKLVYPCLVFSLLVFTLLLTAVLFCSSPSLGKHPAQEGLAGLGLAAGLLPVLLAIAYTIPGVQRKRGRLHLQLGLERWLRSQPLLGRLACCFETSLLAKSLALALESGLTLERALPYHYDLPPSLSGRRGLVEARRRLLAGGELEEVLQALPFLRPDALAMLEMGASAGRFVEALELSARYCEQEIEAAVEAAVALLVPALIGALGVIVGVSMLFVFLPIYGQIEGL